MEAVAKKPIAEEQEVKKLNKDIKTIESADKASEEESTEEKEEEVKEEVKDEEKVEQVVKAVE